MTFTKSSHGFCLNPRSVNRLVVAGWTGRDSAAVEEHIVELEKLGVERPKEVPCFYYVSADRVTCANSIEVSGRDTSGEVEFVIAFQGDGQLLVGVGSDHTDRQLESINVSQSKQICEKPIAPHFWDYADVKDHWDELVLRSYIYVDGEKVLYQEGEVTAMLHPEALIEKHLTSRYPLGKGDIMMCGTLAAIGGIRESDLFSFELHDPVHSRVISHDYSIKSLPIS